MKRKRTSFMTLISTSAYQFLSLFSAMRLSTCWTDSAAFPMPVLPSRETSRWPCLDRAVGQPGAAVSPQGLVKLPYKTFNKGESRWQELFFLPLAFLGPGQPLNLQGHQLLERLKERQSWRRKLPRRWTQPWAQLGNRQTCCWAYV